MMKKLIKFSAIPVLAVAFSAPALATPKSYVVDPTHSFANFSYTHMGLSEQESRFDGTSGTIVYDAAAKTGAVMSRSTRPRWTRAPTPWTSTCVAPTSSIRPSIRRPPIIHPHRVQG